MKIVLLANNIVGLKIAQYLKKNNENIACLFLHNKDKAVLDKQIGEELNLPKKYIFRAKKINNKTTINLLKKINPDLLICAFWGYILKNEVISIPKLGAINIHPGYLPHNRGLNPNVWPIIENTAAGVTIHFVDKGIDTGDIINRTKIKVLPTDTAEILYNKTLVESVNLFKKTWPKIKSGKINRIPQGRLGKSTYHNSVDIKKIDEIKLDKSYKAGYLINLLRARSYSDRFYSYYKIGNKKIYVRLQIKQD